MRYKANWRANDSIMPFKPLTSTNKNKLISEVRSIANENRFTGSTCEWWVWDSDKNIIAAGKTTAKGIQRLLYGYDLADKAYDEGLFFKK